MSDEKPFDRLAELDRLYGRDGERELFAEIGGAATSTRGLELDIVDALMLGISSIARAPSYLMPYVPIVEEPRPRDGIRLGAMFPPTLIEALLIVRLFDDRANLRDSFWDTMRFFSMINFRPLRRRGKAKKRRRVEEIKRRNC